MVRLLPFFCVIFLLPLVIKGQSPVTCDPTFFTLSGTQNQPDVVYHITVTNISNETVDVYWSKRMSNEPSPWYSFICDKNLCYDSAVNSCPISKPNKLLAGEAMDLQVHLGPLQTIGTGDYDLNITDVNGNPFCTFNAPIEISPATGVKETGDSRLSVFPNPTDDFFKVSETPGLRYIEIFNIIGTKVKTYDAAPQKQYYVGDLTDGIYLVRLVTSTKKVLKTVRLSKR